MEKGGLNIFLQVCLDDSLTPDIGGHRSLRLAYLEELFCTLALLRFVRQGLDI